MKKLLLYLVFSALVFAQNTTIESNNTALMQKSEFNQDVEHKTMSYQNSIKLIDKELKGNIWITRFSSYLTYQRLLKELDTVDNKINSISKRKQKSDEYKSLQSKQKTLERQIELLKEFKRSPLSQLVKPPAIEQSPKISNPIAIISGFSYIKQLQSDEKTYRSNLLGLENVITKLSAKKDLLTWLEKNSPTEEISKELDTVTRELGEFKASNDISKTTLAVYMKKIDEATLLTTNEIKDQVKRAFNIALFILVSIIISLIFKYFVRKYITDNVRYYMANKVINFINVSLIILILLFAYIENVTYIVTVVGFASAGIAIAMKDMFMSVLGWMVVVFGGSFHVGDRVKVRKEGLTYVGDIIDISLLRMTVLEDVTLTTYVENRRSGRIVFIPNNYIFTDLIANYTHATMSTVWDGIDVTVSFDSNHKKAMYIMKDITRKYSKGYTNLARKHLNKLRSQYSLQNTNVEPRIFSFLEPYGMTISVWYMTNSYATLTMRSTISADIIQAFNKEDDITIAYPTQTLHLNSKKPREIQDLEG